VRFVFVMDPLERLDAAKDTTFGLVAAALERGHACLHCCEHELEIAGGEAFARVRALEVTAGGRGWRLGAERERVALGDVEAVFVRTDPPFDDAYLHATLVLELLRGRTLVVNDPRGLREANEKLYGLRHFARYMPRTLVTADREAIHAFAADVGGAAVIKPLDGAGGFGVLAVRAGDDNARAIVDMLTEEGRRLAIVQEYLPEVMQGDKRVLVLDGEPLGAILRVPRPGELRANIHVGGTVVHAELSAGERALVSDVGERLRADGLYFVGLDLIGERLTEVNVTSPTGIRELAELDGGRPSDRVIAWVESRAR
jgi:glutathione synthase